MRDKIDLANQLKPAVSTLRTIVASLAGGVVVFAVLAIWMRLAGPQEPVEISVPVLTILAVVLFPLALAASRVVAAMLVRNSRRQIATDNRSSRSETAAAGESQRIGALCGVFQTKTIIAAAFLEGAALVSIFAFMLEGSPLALLLAGLLVAALIAMAPSAARVADWIERQLRLVDEEARLVP
jgi:hypothetical protein